MTIHGEPSPERLSPRCQRLCAQARRLNAKLDCMEYELNHCESQEAKRLLMVRGELLEHEMTALAGELHGHFQRPKGGHQCLSVRMRN